MFIAKHSCLHERRICCIVLIYADFSTWMKSVCVMKEWLAVGISADYNRSDKLTCRSCSLCACVVCARVCMSACV